MTAKKKKAAQLSPYTLEEMQSVRDQIRKLVTERYAGHRVHLATATGCDISYLHRMLDGTKPVTRSFVDRIKQVTGVEIFPDLIEMVRRRKADEASARKERARDSPMWAVQLVANNLRNLSDEEMDLLLKLVDFRLGGELVSPRRVINTIIDITMLENVIV